MLCCAPFHALLRTIHTAAWSFPPRQQCQALYHPPPIAWSIDEASDFHYVPDYTVEHKIVPDSNAIVWMFAIFFCLHRLEGFWSEQPLCYRSLHIVNKPRSRIRILQFYRKVSDGRRKFFVEERKILKRVLFAQHLQPPVHDQTLAHATTAPNENGNIRPFRPLSPLNDGSSQGGGAG